MASRTELSVSYILARPISQYMVQDILILNQEVSTSYATSLLHRYERDEIIVVDENKKPIGIVTDEDILKKVADVSVLAETTKLREIMNSPLITIDEAASLRDALLLMKEYKIKKLAVTSNETVVGLITQSAIANAIRYSVMVPPRFLSPPLKAILGNLGFVLQFGGVLIMIPAVLATILNETAIASGIYLSALMLLVTGFFLNSYGEKAPLNLRQASVLVFSSLFLLTLFGTVPYLYVSPYKGDSEIELFANSFFSSAAGFTTGGISLFDKPEELPQSFTFYRSFTQLVGGMSFIYLVLTAFYPENKLRSMRGFITGKTLHLRELFTTIAIIFMLYIVIVALLLYYFGERNIIDNFSLAMTTLSTGGFLPHSQILVDLLWQEYVVLIVAMILGALPFTFHYAYIRKEAIPPKFGKEIAGYFIVLGIGIVLLIFSNNFDVLNSIFYATAASTTAGLQISSTLELNSMSLGILSLLMFIGGCGFSTAGGIKIYRILLLRNIPKIINKKSRQKLTSTTKNEITSTAIIIILFPTIALLTSLYFVSQGHDFGESFFDSTALITTGGLSTGAITTATDPSIKIVFAFLMIFGRLEIIAIIFIFVPKLGS